MKGKTMCSKSLPRVLMVAATLAMATEANAASSHNYTDALSKCILFFEGQRSGRLPPSQQIPWRKDSGLTDGSDIGRDLVGGYFDAGDYVKFTFPMAFTTTMLAWSVIEFGDLMGSNHQHALEAIRWGTDYLIKATAVPGTVVGVVGDPNGDHSCWQRPEDMDTPRTSYVVDKQKPGSEVSAEIAAALAASSIVFKDSDRGYSALLLDRATKVFEFADMYRGTYNDSIGDAVCPFYCDFSGYMDELVWGASWLYKATEVPSYWSYVRKNIHYLASTVISNVNGEPVLHITGDINEFGWDSKHSGIDILVSQWLMTDSNNSSPFIPKADQFVCSILPESPAPKSVSYSPGGLLFKQGGSNLQHSTSLSFLLLVYVGYLKDANKVVDCGNNVVVTPARLVNFTKGQVDYILGSNPLGMSYMVGFGEKFPQKIHHRGSALPSIAEHPEHIECHGGDPYFTSKDPNPNLLTGAIPGGPAEDDTFEDSRVNYLQSEPTTYINAPFVGVLAYFKSLLNS